MSGLTPWAQIWLGWGGWRAVAGDAQAMHWFEDTTRPQWWTSAKCGAGPAVGKSDRDAKLAPCLTCLPIEPEDLEDAEGIHV